MAIYDTFQTNEANQQVKKSSDILTKILNKETSGPRTRDILGAANRNVLNVGQGVATRVAPQDMQTQRIAGDVMPQAELLKIAQQAAQAGSGEAKGIMDTFSKFADNSEDLGLLFAAAESDPEEVTSANAATFAARKAKELGLRSVSKMQAENQRMFAESSMLRANKGGSSPTSSSSFTGGGSLPTDSQMESMSGGDLLPPPDESSRQTVRVDPNMTFSGGSPEKIDVNTSKDITKMASALNAFKTLAETSHPKYFNYGKVSIGNSEVPVGRMVGDALGDIKQNISGASGDDQDFSAWWSKYQGQINMVRKDLFGSALTSTEKAEFDKENVSKGMDDKLAVRILRDKENTLKRALARMSYEQFVSGVPLAVAASRAGLTNEQLFSIAKEAQNVGDIYSVLDKYMPYQRQTPQSVGTSGQGQSGTTVVEPPFEGFETLSPEEQRRAMELIGGGK